MEGRRETGTFDGVTAECDRFREVARALNAQGVELGAWLAASRYAAVFEVVRYRGSAPGQPMVAKLPWLMAAPKDEHPDIVERGAGPALVRLVSLTGPFVLESPATEADAARLIEVPAAHQRACGASAPLPRLIDLLSASGRPVALHARVQGHDLAWMIAYWPGRARRLLPGLARAMLELHASYGPHGDLKPEHVFSDFKGTAAPVLIDPLGPLAGQLFGSIGWQLPLPTGAATTLADLIALAQIVAACWGDGLPWNGRLAYLVCNRGNGRFGRGFSPEVLRAELPTALPLVPAPWRAWALGAVDALYASYAGEHVRAHDEGWIGEQLKALAAMPPWVGDDRG